ncbi:caspase-1 isoform X2 [Hermetia illucens]|nr:caspase-1 isoform X2 [Hermetia illucens]
MCLSMKYFGLFKKKKKTPKVKADAADGGGKTIVIPQPAGTDEYDINHSKAGVAIIFNHKHIKGQATRNGTEQDRDRLESALKLYGFDVSVYNDLTFDEVTNTLEKAAQQDYSNVNCLCITLLSHGLPGQVFASDTYYPVEFLWDRFLGDKCPTLVGKPKLFFIQACRGTNLDAGVNIMFRSMPTETAQLTYTIPSKADLLIMYSTYEGDYSWRNSTNGSWFIQSLCLELEAAAQEDDVELIYLLTSVARRVAYDYQSNVPNDQSMNEMKQMPTYMSTLTKVFYLKKKPDEDEEED